MFYENTDMNEETFNSIEEVSSAENIENSNKKTVINIDARSWNTISESVDLDSISDYIADKLYEAVSASAEVVHDV